MANLAGSLHLPLSWSPLSLYLLLAKCSGLMVEPACSPGNPCFSLSGLGNLLLDPPSALFGVPASLVKL